MIRKILALFASGSEVAQSSSKDNSLQAIPHTNNLYPYVVPEEYLKCQPKEPTGISRPLGHGLYIVLVRDLGGLVQNVLLDELTAIGLTPEQAHSQSLANLENLVENKTVGMTMFPKGPQGRPFILFGGHWIAATCILLPGLWEMISSPLGAAEVCVCIPHRDALLAFAKCDVTYRREMVRMIQEKENNGPKPLTFSLFELSKDGVRELQDETDPPTLPNGTAPIR
jgi:hypothetical protein